MKNIFVGLYKFLDKHSSLFYYDREITGYYHMYIDKSKLKEKYSKKRHEKKLQKKK